MPTALQLTPAQLAQLTALRAPANSSTKGAWAPFYECLAQCIRDIARPLRAGNPVNYDDVLAIRSFGSLPES